MRKTTADQAVIPLSNIELPGHYTTTARSKVLNREPFKLDVKSSAVTVGKGYTAGAARRAAKVGPMDALRCE